MKLIKNSPDTQVKLAFALFFVVLISHLPALSSWWCLDDWGQLARSAGVSPPADGFPARWFSQHAWWSLTWPIFKLNAHAHTFIRIFLHGLSTVLVFRIGRLAGLSSPSSFFGGLLFATSPFAFTPIFWASGIQELFGGFFALLSIERWLGQSSARNILLSGIFAILSIFSKESGFGLPVLFASLLIFRWPKPLSHMGYRWLITATVFSLVFFEGVLITHHFATGKDSIYATGGVLTILNNLGKYGWWMTAFNPIFASKMTPALVISGGAFFLVWGIWGLFSARRGAFFPIVALLWTALSLGPALPLVKQTHPYLAYLAVTSFYLALGYLIPQRFGQTRALIPVLILLGTVGGFWGMSHRIQATNSRGLPGDPVVRASQLSKDASRVFYSLRTTGSQPGSPGVFILQPPLSEADVEKADQLGPDHVIHSPRYMSLEGTLGPKLILGPGAAVEWKNNLLTIPENSRVLCESGKGFLDWGGCWNALLYATILDVGLGHYDRARRHLLRAYSINPAFHQFRFNPEISAISKSKFETNSPGYVEWLNMLKNTNQFPEGEFQVLKSIFFSLAAEI